jgi:hypothetical protein
MQARRFGPARSTQGYRVWISFRRSPDHLGNRPQAPGDMIPSVSSEGSRGRPDTFRCGSPVPPPLRAGQRKRTAFPPPQRNGAAKIVSPCATQASARPGGREAPAGGGAGACLYDFRRPCRLMGLARRDGGHRPCGLAGCGPWRALVQRTVARGVAPAFRPVPDGYMSARLARQAREMTNV